MLLPHIIATLREERRLALALPISVFREEDRKALEPTYQAPGQGARGFSIVKLEPARAFQFEIGRIDDDDSDDE